MDPIAAFVAHALADPDRPALTVGDEVVLTRDELLRAAADVAGQLSALTAAAGTAPPDGPGVAVASRSPEVLLAGMLGARMAGWWYLPVDGAQPAARVASFTATARCSAVLTIDDAVAAACAPTPVLAVPDGGGSAAASVAATRGDALQYRLFTSGSTGSPKGAGVRRDAFDRLIDWYVGATGLGADDRVLVVSSPGFDLSQKNYWAALATGATLVFPRNPSLFDPRAVRDAAQRWGASVVNCAPTAFFTVAEWRSPWPCPLRLVVLGGERVDGARLDRWRDAARFTGAVVNGYGPTECTSVVAASGPTTATERLDVLSPVCGSLLYVVGPDRREVPVGEPGELWIGGDPVGTGYVGNDRGTTERFVPCLHRPGALAFRSGDLAVAEPDGAVRILRRMDAGETKIAGMRVDLNEVREAVAAAPGVLAADAFAATDAAGRTQLGAVVTPSGIDPAALRRALLAQLPPSHIPTAVVSLDVLPRTTSGKTDWRTATRQAAEASGLRWTAPAPVDTGTDYRVLRTTVAPLRHGVWPCGAETPAGWTTVVEPLPFDRALDAVVRSAPRPAA